MTGIAPDRHGPHETTEIREHPVVHGLVLTVSLLLAGVLVGSAAGLALLEALRLLGLQDLRPVWEF
jgi:hypothetical protein